MHIQPSKPIASFTQKGSVLLSAALLAMCSLSVHSQDAAGSSASGVASYAKAPSNVQINGAPMIVQQPQNQVKLVDNDAIFSVVATPGTNAANTQLWYQWQIIDDEDPQRIWKNVGTWTKSPKLEFKGVQNINNATLVRVIVGNYSNGWKFVTSHTALLEVIIQVDPQE